MSEEYSLETPVETELDALKARADLMGIKYKSNIGLKSLREKVNAAVEGQGAVDDEDEVVVKQPTKGKSRKEIGNTGKTAEELVLEARRLRRIRVSCMNPAKREYEGEIFTAGNSIVGTHKKMVPFNVVWHVPEIIYQMIKDRECQVFTTVKTKNGVSVRSGRMIPEFAVEELPDLTEKERNELAQRQQMASGTAEAL